jgi:hypothetical protein
MKALLVDVDSKIPNLALMKISAWHKGQGDEVGFAIENPDKVYISCIFTKNAGQARGIAKFYPDAEIDIGGSGVDLIKRLPGKIENIKPDYDLYPSTYSQGYTTRGCIRKCGFCIVPEKEGYIKQIQHPHDFHDPRFDTCMIMDNNLFAAQQDWQESVFDWFIENKIKMLSPQGWDIRLLTKRRAELLKQVKHAGKVHFAWDNMKDESAVLKGIDTLINAGFTKASHQISFYVLAGFDTSLEEDVYRAQKLKDIGVQAFVMPYRRTREIRDLARWANRPELFWSTSFKEYVEGK